MTSNAFGVLTLAAVGAALVYAVREYGNGGGYEVIPIPVSFDGSGSSTYTNEATGEEWEGGDSTSFHSGVRDWQEQQAQETGVITSGGL